MEFLIIVTQLLVLAGTFVIIPIAAQKYGNRAQEAAEKSVTNQGFEPGILLKNGVKMTESKVEMLLPFAFAVVYAAVAIFTILTGQINHVLLRIIEGFTFVVVGMVTAQQVFVAPFLKRAFAKSKDEHLRQINVDRFVEASLKEFPFWLRGAQVVRFILATAGSLLVLAFVL